MVAGAGIGGTAFALAAARHGWQVALLEREQAPRAPARPEILWNASVETLDALGVGERFRDQAAAPLEGIEVWQPDAKRRLLRLSQDDMAAGLAAPWATDPGATRRILLEAAVATGRVDHLPGTTVESLLHENGQATGVRATGPKGETLLRAPLVVGDDGARSNVRHASGIALDAHPFPVEFLATSIARPAELPAREARAYVDPKGFQRGVGLALLVPLDARRVAVVFGARHGTFAHDADGPRGAFAEKVRALLPPSIGAGFAADFPAGFTRSVRPVGHAERYWRPGVALLGDAAHPVSPIGGQGANMALADAMALAETVLPETPRGAAPTEATLATYEARRRGANARSLAFSRRASPVARALWTAPALAHAVPAALRLLDGSPQHKARLLGAVGAAFQARAPREAAAKR